MKKFLATAATIALLVPSLASAAYNDVTLTTDAILSVNGTDITITGTSAVVASAEVGATTVIFSMPSGSRIEMQSASGTAMTASDTTIVTVNTCSTNTSNLSINNTGDSTITETVTVAATHCDVAASGGSSGGGSSFGGGGGSSGGSVATTFTTTATPAAPTTPATPAATSGNDVAALVAQLKSLIQLYISLGGAATPEMMALAGGSTSGSFSRNLEVGSTGDDVMALQKFLNSHGFPVAASGAGSAGNETTKFGAATKAALMKFQAANGISPAAGYFGPKTRAIVNGM